MDNKHKVINLIKQINGRNNNSCLSKRKTYMFQHLACSAKTNDNLLVEAEIFSHCRGRILCDMKRLQFNPEKNKNVRSQFRKSSMPLRHPFKIYWGIASVCATKKCLHYKGPIVIFGGSWIKNVFTQVISCIRVTSVENIWCVNIYYLKSCSCLGIKNNLH